MSDDQEESYTHCPHVLPGDLRVCCWCGAPTNTPEERASACIQSNRPDGASHGLVASEFLPE